MGQSTTEKTNAETQTAIRGVAIMESGCGHAPSGGISVSAMAEETLFFTECESCKQTTKAKPATAAARLTPPVTTKTVSQNLRHQNQNQQTKFEKRKQFSSTPNVAASSINNISRTSRKETLPKRNQTRPSIRKHSLSPTRQYSELPGSPDQLDQEKSDRKRTKRSNTVVSPIHNRKM